MRRAFRNLCVASAALSVVVFVSAAHAQDQSSTPSSLENEVAEVRAENIALRAQLLKLEEQQRTLLEQINELQRLIGGAAPAAITASQGTKPPSAGDASTKERQTNADNAPPQQAVEQAVEKTEAKDHYRDGIIIWENPEDAKVPLLLKLNDDTQIRYLNTTDSQTTFTDHLGVVREVHTRNDITVNRSMFNFNGYIFDTRLIYSLKVWTSAGAASIVVAGNVGWQFNKALTIIGGYTGVPGSRSLVNTFPFFQPTDRSMVDNLFRPGFTQGAWAFGEPLTGLNYLAFIGNGLNTLNISANKIDTKLMGAASVWWEPLGPYSEPGKSRNMYDDYFALPNPRIRIGTSFTRSREDRFSELDVLTPDNTSIHNSDGVLLFSTGSLALGVTIQLATYKMWAIDWGLKKSGFSVNGQYYFRWLYDFDADGPLPLSSTFDNGFELSAGYFVIPKTLMPYARGSKLFGQFRSPYESAVGVKWYFLPTDRVWLTAELMNVQRGSPYGGAFTPYTAGMTGRVPMLQTVLAF